MVEYTPQSAGSNYAGPYVGGFREEGLEEFGGDASTRGLGWSSRLPYYFFMHIIVDCSLRYRKKISILPS